jgi:hypothetical protein
LQSDFEWELELPMFFERKRKMKNIIGSFLFLICVSLGLFAQEAPKATFHVWSDQFATPQGVMLYPQYGWGLKTGGGNVNGFGFIEVTSHEQAFTNNLVWYTPSKVPWFSVHTETGGFPFHDAGFFQVGPRINVTKAIPQLNKPIANLFVAVLPRFIGIRPNNILVGGATNAVKIKGVSVWGEGYRRFFPNGSGYGEYWLMAKPTPKSPISFGVIGHHVTGNSYVGVGMRLSFF